MSIRATAKPFFLLFLLTCIGVIGPAETEAQNARKREAGREPLTARLMTFNIRFNNPNDGVNAWPNRKDRVFEVLIGSGTPSDPAWDVIGLQEVLEGQLREIQAAVPGYASVGVGRDDGKTEGEYAPILYKQSRFEPIDSGTFWLSDTPSVIASTSWDNVITRICTWARLKDRETGRELAVYNAHFDHRGQGSRVRSAELIAVAAATRPNRDSALAIMGDFNADEDNPAMKLLRGEEVSAEALPAGEPLALPSPPLIDSWRAVHPNEPARGTFSRWRADETRGGKIDTIFVQRDAHVVDARIDREAGATADGRAPSDHFPVTAVVRWP